MSVSCECCVLSVRGLCEELITRPEESYRLCCVAVCDLETSLMRRPWPALGRSATKKIYMYIYVNSVSGYFNRHIDKATSGLALCLPSFLIDWYQGLFSPSDKAVRT